MLIGSYRICAPPDHVMRVFYFHVIRLNVGNKKLHAKLSTEVAISSNKK